MYGIAKVTDAGAGRFKLIEHCRTRAKAAEGLHHQSISKQALAAGDSFLLVRESDRGWVPDAMNPPGGIRLLAGSDGRAIELSGIAYPFNSDWISPSSSGWTEQDIPMRTTANAIKSAVDKANFVTLTPHHGDDAPLLAATEWGNLQLWTTDVGLWVRAWPLATPEGRKAVHQIERGRLRGLSIQHKPKAATKFGSGNDRRRLVTATVLDHIALTGAPAAKGARVWISGSGVGVSSDGQHAARTATDGLVSRNEHRVGGNPGGRGKSSRPTPTDRSPRRIFTPSKL